MGEPRTTTSVRLGSYILSRILQKQIGPSFALFYVILFFYYDIIFIITIFIYYLMQIHTYFAKTCIEEEKTLCYYSVPIQ